MLPDLPPPPAYIAGWDARESNPVFDPQTGAVLSMGRDLADQGATFTVINVPRMNLLPVKGVILPGAAEVGGARAGFVINLPNPASGVWFNRKLLVAAVVTPTNLIGDGTQGAGRVFTTGSGAGVSKWFTNQGALHEAGRLTVSGGSAPQSTAGRSGIERQVVVGLFNPDGARAYASSLSNANPLLAATTNSSFTQVRVGVWPELPTANPFVGVVHAVHVYLFDSSQPLSSPNFTPEHAGTVIDLLASDWGVRLEHSKLVSISGDSISYPSATVFDHASSPAPGSTHTLLTAPVASGATVLPVGDTTGLAGRRFILESGTDLAETITVLTASAPSGSGTITVRPTKYAHDRWARLDDNNYGFVTPYVGAPMLARTLQDHKIFNFSFPARQLAQVTGNPAQDGSMGVYGAADRATHIIARGTNDMFNGMMTAPACLQNAVIVANNARANGAQKVLVCQVLPRIDASGMNAGNAQSNLYNSMLLGSGAFDGVIREAAHPLLQFPDNPQYILGPEPTATGATRIIGCIYDPIGVHPRHFGQACRALMWDDAYAAAWGEPVPYRPGLKPISAIRSSLGIKLRWSTPVSPQAPTVLGDRTAGASFLAVKIRHHGELIATVYPATINVNTGKATYVTTYHDLSSTDPVGYTLECVDAAGNSSGELALR